MTKKYPRKKQLLCWILLCFFSFMGIKSSLAEMSQEETKKQLESFARETLMGKVLQVEDTLLAGAQNLQFQAQSSPPWERVKDGLEFIVLGDADNPFIALRIQPSLYDFTLCMSSEEGQALPLKDWGELRGLHAAINASMYLPDGQTSTGHMQSGSHSNNEHIGSRLGAFFVADPLYPDLDPSVAIIEKSDPQWERRLERYAIRVQNYRLLTRGGVVTWRGDKEGERGSIGAIGQNKDGSILFMVSVHPLTVKEFCQIAQTLAPDLERAMYVEGSVKVGLFLKEGAQSHTWLGRKNVLYTPAPKDTAIPNVIGVIPRKK